MKYVFFGSPRFASIVLNGLMDAGFPPAAVVCNPDRPVGRKKIVTPPPVKSLVAAPVAILQPEKLDAAFAEDLKALAPDFFVVAAYAKIIPQAILDIPRFGTLGVHPSLLPCHRGSSPIQSAILDGDRETGTTIYLMDAKMDHGPIVAREAVPLDALAASYEDLEAELASLGVKLLSKIIPQFAARGAEGLSSAHAGAPVAQDESLATYTRKFTTEDGRVEERDLGAAQAGDQKTAEAILRTMNALGKEPGVWTMMNGIRVKLLAARIENGVLHITRIQEEGGVPKDVRVKPAR